MRIPTPSLRLEIDPENYIEVRIIEGSDAIRRFDYSMVWGVTPQGCFILKHVEELDCILYMLEEKLKLARDGWLEIEKPPPEDLAILWARHSLEPSHPESACTKAKNNGHGQYELAPRGGLREFFSYHRLFSNSRDLPEVWIYTRNSRIYIEGASDYRWSFEDPPAVYPYDTSFEYWLRNYHPLFNFEISYEQARHWLRQIADLRARCVPYPSEQDSTEPPLPTGERRRIGIANGEFVVSCATSDGEWHQYATSWQGPHGECLTKDLQGVLLDAGIVDRKGIPQPREAWYPPNHLPPNSVAF